jgi:hypothetical protein
MLRRNGVNFATLPGKNFRYSPKALELQNHRSTSPDTSIVGCLARREQRIALTSPSSYDINEIMRFLPSTAGRAVNNACC